MQESEFKKYVERLEKAYTEGAAVSSRAWDDLRKEFTKNALRMEADLNSVRNDFEKVRKIVQKIDQTLEYAIRDIDNLSKEFHEHKNTFSNKVAPKIETWNSMADSQKWIGRVVMGSVILGLLALLFTSK